MLSRGKRRLGARCVRTEGMDYPSEFSKEARNAVEAGIILARRTMLEARRTLPIPSHYASYSSDEFEQAFLRTIMTVFLIFASNAVDLCRAGDWSLDRVDQESREFLRLLTLTWRYEEGRDRAGNQIREVCGTWGGGLVRWVEEKFEALSEWTEYEDMRLSAIGRAVRSSPAPQPEATSTPPDQTISPGFAPSRRGFGEVPLSAGTEQSITSFA